MEKFISVAELCLGDVVRLPGGFPFADAVVKQVVRKLDANPVVTLERPYMVTQDFEYTGGVICSLGHEDIVMSTGFVYLLSKKGPLK